jgi:hypothetical protein
MNRFLCAGLAGLAAILSGGAAACTSCGCSLGTEWADQNLASTESAVRLNLRYDFVDQSQLRSGGRERAMGSIKFPADREIQQDTLTRFYFVGTDYSFGGAWGLNLQLPWLDRKHATIDAGETAVATSYMRGAGDLRIVGRYQGAYGGAFGGFFENHRLGLQFGLKLPTGAIHDRFATGPNAGETIDRGLQNGTGTTDLLIGAYATGSIVHRWDCFEQLQIKQALDSKEQFRPGAQVALNLGLRYVASEWLIAQLQLNARFEGRETGAQSDDDNSGSRTVYLSPGVTAGIGTPWSVYGFVQVPVYQYYNGDQLAPPYIVSAGMNYRF